MRLLVDEETEGTAGIMFVGTRMSMSHSVYLDDRNSNGLKAEGKKNRGINDWSVSPAHSALLKSGYKTSTSWYWWSSYI